MKIAHLTRFTSDKMIAYNGYGYATERILASLRNTGYDLVENDHTADASFWFEQPWRWVWGGDKYKIGYHPWESTLLLPDWPAMMNECDEIWTPSPLTAFWYKEYNDIKPPVYVYQHGVDSVWTTKERQVDDVVRFLHVGGEAVRKGMPTVLKAFRAAFQGTSNASYVALTCKMAERGYNLAHHSNVNVIAGPLPIEQLVSLHHDHHVFVYPSWGEGFGLNPIQAMATGMPTVSTYDWMPYSRFMDPALKVESTFTDSPFSEHPGKMFKPDFDDLVDKMRYVVENYGTCSHYAVSTAGKLKMEYDWDLLTKNTFDALEKRLVM